jgi:hypothetical protein
MSSEPRDNATEHTSVAVSMCNIFISPFMFISINHPGAAAFVPHALPLATKLLPLTGLLKEHSSFFILNS